MFDQIEGIFQLVVSYGILLLDAVGAVVIMIYSIRSIICLCKKKSDMSRHVMTEGITTGLSFLLGSEVLKTIVAPDWSAIGMTCAILLIRAAVTILVRWENKVEREVEANEKQPEKAD